MRIDGPALRRPVLLWTPDPIRRRWESPMKFEDYAEQDATGLAALAAAGEVTPGELLDAAIARAETVNPALNAIVHRFDQRARDRVDTGLPDGPFRGVPFLLKDLTAAIAGEPLTGGSHFDADYRPDYDHAMVERFLAAGLVPFAKTNCPEWGLAPVTEPRLFGPCRNPWNPSLTPGGSSGGSAAAVAAGVVPAAHANDGGGSIRIPASCCGLVGLKPSRGRTPAGPVRRDAWWGASIDHVVTRTVRDTAAFLDAVRGPDAGAPYAAPPPPRPYRELLQHDPAPLRIALCAEPLLSRAVDPACRSAAEQAAQLFADAGHHVESFTPPLPREAFLHAYMVLLAANVRAEAELGGERRGRRPRRGELEPTTRALSRLGAALTGHEVALAWEHIGMLARRFARALDGYDVLLTPTLSQTPRPLGALDPRGVKRAALGVLNTLPVAKGFLMADALELFAEDVFEFIGYTPPANITGQPSISLPLGEDDGVPVGVLATGRYGEEHVLLGLAAQAERARPWHRRFPAAA